MSVDIEALKTLAQEKKLPLERLINAIENEVAKAYAELPVAKPHGRAVLNRQSGELVIYVPVLGPDGDRIDTVTDKVVKWQTAILVLAFATARGQQGLRHL